MSDRIYKIVSKSAWAEAEKAGVFKGAEIDLADGYIHFSSADQVVETASKHFAGRENLVLVAVISEHLGEQLKWEKSRNDELFPHLYGELEMSAIDSVNTLPLKPDGTHEFSGLLT